MTPSCQLPVKTTTPLPPRLARLLLTQATGSTHPGPRVTSRPGAMSVVFQFLSHRLATRSLHPSAATAVSLPTTSLLTLPMLLLRHPLLLQLLPTTSPMLFLTHGQTARSRSGRTRTALRSHKAASATSLSLWPASTALSSLVTTPLPRPHLVSTLLLPRLVTDSPRLLQSCTTTSTGSANSSVLVPLLPASR